MGRPRKPTTLHALNGTLDHNPARFADRATEPKDDRPLGPPPDRLKPDERAAWMEIDRLAPWLAAADRLAVEITACLMAAFRIAGVQYTPPPQLAQLAAMLGKLGLTPSDRSKVSAVDAAKPSGNRFASNGKRPGAT